MKKLSLFVMICLLLGVTATDVVAQSSTNKLKKRQIIVLKKEIDDASKKIDITFNKADIRDVIRFFSKEFKLNIIAGAKVKGNVSFTFNNLDIIDAFDSILISQGFDWHFDNHVIYVYPQQPMEVISLNYMNALVALESIQKMVSHKGHISVNEASNSLIVKAPREDMQKIRLLISELDTKPQQVLVEVKILEIQGDNSFILGMGPNHASSDQTSAQNKNVANSFDTGGSGFFVNVLGNDISAAIEGLDQQKNVEVLATPRILSLNHKEAIIITGQRLGYKVNTSSTSGSFVNESINFLEVRTKLRFTPHIANNGDITMQIKPEVSEGSIVDGLPQENTTETTTEVLVRDGQTIMIGGLIRKKTSEITTGFPLLTWIPFIGNIFSRTEQVTVKKETMVLITPHLVTDKNQKELLQKSFF